MGGNIFEFVDKSDPREIKPLLFNADDILAIEKDKIAAIGNPGKDDQFVVAIYTRSNILGKKSNCLVLSFSTQESRDKTYESIRDRLNPTTFEARWFPV